MRRARGLPIAVVVLAALVAAGCAEKETNPFDPSQDRVPPAVTAFSYENGVASWTTDEPALCVLEYAPSGGDYRNYVYESTKEFTESHSVTVLAMEGGESYDVRIRSRDRAGNEDYQTDIDLPVEVTGTAFTGLTMRLSVIDVGWGLSMAMETPGGSNILIDAGSDDHLDDVLSFLYEKDITYLDYAVGTHHHADHTGGFIEDGGVLDTFGVGAFIAPDSTFILDAFDSALREKLNQHNIPVSYVFQGDNSSNRDVLAWDSTPGFFVEVLSAGVGRQFGPDPPPEGVEGNNDSIVFRFTFGGVNYVTMADGEFFVERYLLDNYAHSEVRADVLQVAHHANDDATSEFWLENVDPRVCLISNAMI